MGKNSKTKILAIIPARGGSKGIKNKNIKLLCGQPLIAYTLKAAKNSKCITDIVTTTDSEKIARVAQKYGSEVIIRSPSLAEDTTPMIPVVLHVLEQLAIQGREYDYIILLQPTCPLRTAKDIDGALYVLMHSTFDAVMSVYRVWDHHPARMYYLKQRMLIPFNKKWQTANRQDLPPLYHRSGLIYAVKENIFKKKKTFMPANSGSYEIPLVRSINIDEKIDLLFADFLLRNKYV